MHYLVAPKNLRAIISVMSESVDCYMPNLSAKQLDSTLIRLKSTQRRCEWLVCRYLADMDEGRRFRDVGWYSDVFQYAKERLNLGVKVTRERMRIGKALRELPRIEQAFVAGDLSYSKVREITRVAAAENESYWLELALHWSIGEVERQVAGQLGGKDATDEVPVKVRWRTPKTVEVNMVLPADTWALLARAVQGVRQAAEEPLSDAEAIAAVATEALASLCSAGTGASAADPRKAVVLYHCKDCGQSEIETNAGAVPLSPAAAEQHGCGAKVVDLDAEGWGESFGGEIPAPVRRAVLARDRGRCRACGRRRYVEVHHIKPRSQGGAHSRAGMACMCSACHAAVHEGQLRVEGDAETGLRFFDQCGNQLADRLEGGSAMAKGVKPKAATAAPAATPRMSREAAAVLAAMGQRGGWHPDHLAVATGLHIRAVNRALLQLQLAGLIGQDNHLLWMPLADRLFGRVIPDADLAHCRSPADAPALALGVAPPEPPAGTSGEPGSRPSEAPEVSEEALAGMGEHGSVARRRQARFRQSAHVVAGVTQSRRKGRRPFCVLIDQQAQGQLSLRERSARGAPRALQR